MDILDCNKGDVPVLKICPKASVAFRLKESIRQCPVLSLLVKKAQGSIVFLCWAVDFASEYAARGLTLLCKTG